MRNRVIRLLKIYPVFVWLLPGFFVLHGYTVFYDLISSKDAWMLAGKYWIFAVIFVLLSWLLFKDIYKAAILAFALFFYNFFFGSVHDWLKLQFQGAFVSRYVFILPVSLLLILSLIIFLKKRKKTFFQFTCYLNILLFLLIVLDIINLFTKRINKNAIINFDKNEFVPCSDCNKPDIYYILADEYAGEKQLTELLKFDNSAFENELKKRGFHIIENPESNYNYTIFSAPSILNMDYIHGIEGRNQSIHDRKICMDIIENNPVFRFFKAQGYQTYNYSPFHISGHPVLAIPSFLPRYASPITAQTFLFRTERDLWFHLVTDFKLPGLKESVIYNDKKNNELFIKLTKEIAGKQTAKPKFVYTHLIMPHYPYYYDKDGNETPYEFLTGEKGPLTSLYLNYLLYSNKVFLDLIDTIKISSTRPVLIIFMSDHGFKSFPNYEHAEYDFTNFNSLLLPDSNYAPFYNGISNVNQFRVLLNSQFRQKLTLLKDSTSFIRE